ESGFTFPMRVPWREAGVVAAASVALATLAGGWAGHIPPRRRIPAGVPYGEARRRLQAGGGGGAPLSSLSRGVVSGTRVFCAVWSVAACVLLSGPGLAEDQKEGKSIQAIASWSGAKSLVKKRGYFRITSQEEWKRLWNEHRTGNAKGPAIDDEDFESS